MRDPKKTHPKNAEYVAAHREASGMKRIELDITEAQLGRIKDQCPPGVRPRGWLNNHPEVRELIKKLAGDP